MYDVIFVRLMQSFERGLQGC